MNTILRYRGNAAAGLAILIGLYHLYTSFAGIPPIYLHRVIHLCGMMVLTLLLAKLPTNRKLASVLLMMYGFLIAATVVMALHMGINHDAIQWRQGSPTRFDYIFCAMLFFLVIVSTCIRAGWPITVICLFFIAYLLYGHLLTGSLRHAPIRPKLIATEFFNTTGGILGSCIGISSTFIIMFIIFGAFLQESGAGAFFDKLATNLTRNSYGGPAKTAVFASMLLGMINGSAVANIATTGALTIPLMNQNGYPKEFSAAVETTASMGGQIMPPVMGASVFLMAELVGIPYIEICYYALVPAILYYFSIYLAVHFKARTLNLPRAKPEDIEPLGKTLLQGIPYLFAIAMLVGTLVYGWTPMRSGLFSIVALVVGCALRKDTRMSLASITNALIAGVTGSLTIAITCAASGIIMGVVSSTSLGIKLSTYVLALSGGQVWIALAFTILASLILGMGVVSAAAYIILATLLSPVLSRMGINLLAGHLFIYYFGLLSNVTPPVALGALTAAGIAGASFLNTCILSMRMALAAFIIPLIFVMDQRLLLMRPLAECIIPVITAFIGIFIINCGFSGYMLTQIKWPVRLLCVIAGMCLILTDSYTDMIGVALAIVCIVQQVMQRNREVAVRPA